MNKETTSSVREKHTQTQCVHQIRQEIFVPQIETYQNHVNQKDLYPDSKTVEDGESFDENLLSLPGNARENELAKKTTAINRRNATVAFLDVYFLENVAC